MSKDLYKVLDLNKDASDDEIKKAYKKKAMMYHPDRWASKSKEEQAEAESKFKEIGEAYSILSDPQKKKQYDMFGTVDFNGGGQDFSSFDPFDIFKQHFGGFNDFSGFANNYNEVQKGKSLRVFISVNEYDILNGASKTIKYKRQIRCEECHGEGGTGVKSCSKCNGTGRYREVKRSMFGIITSETVCQECGGTGKTIEHKCSKCNGTGFKDIDETLDIKIPVGIQDGQIIVYDKKGSEAKSQNASNGDLQIVIRYNLSENFDIRGNNIYQRVFVPWYKALYGGTISIKLGNGKTISYNIPECTKPDTMLKINDFNTPGYRYYISVSYEIPDNLSLKEKTLLKELN